MTDEVRRNREGVVPGRPEAGGGLATPSFAVPPGAPDGLPEDPSPMRIGARTFAWGTRTYVMGILNVTPDSFSGDGLLGPQGEAVTRGQPPVDAEPSEAVIAAAVAAARQMAVDGADIIDVGGESTRPGHDHVSADAERARVEPVVAAIHAALPDTPLSVDTSKPAVAAAALGVGAAMVNDVWGVTADEAMLELVADRQVPLVLMHNRAAARYTNLMAEVVADLERAMQRALDRGIRWEQLIVDPGFGFGKTASHNVVLLRELRALRILGRPVLLGTSRKSTLGRILDLPPDERVEATLATTVLGIAAGVDMVRVHDVRANARAARTADAVLRAGPGA